MSRTASFVRVGVAYVVAIAVAAVWLVVGPTTDLLWLDALIADVLATFVIFAFSRVHHNSSFYDAYWSVIPPLLLVYWWIEGGLGVDSVRAWLVFVVVLLWAVRLTANWAAGFPGLHHEDWRYGLLRDNAGRWEFLTDLVAIHVIPTGQVFLGMLPVYVAVTHTGDDLIWLTAIATVFGVAAVVLEFVADRQMRRFVLTRAPGQVMADGLWSWSRHPNYFGEFGFWFALALFGVAASPADAWWLFIGALAMLAMFLGASIPMMETRSLERRPEYREVTDRVSRFLPRPPRRVNA
ncbi:DUF1295 domain-containing protein [Williamsia sp.]|uniref:DUF1295 domain-containing protein n=1 Tax=Williamsia sp. TaxID=1872085 RepID=UPI001A2C80DB|nr:DUF1295 domain-containing protein [Williamsia sp.]MBJ7288454.1 DUF1295 domain-containing protein [Williamsia sp.]